MRKKLVVLMLSASICLAGCTSSNNTSDAKTPEATANVTEAAAPEYITEDVKITDPDEALARLQEGNKRFVNNESELINVTSERREELVKGQSPYAVVLSCADSRVTPTAVFNVGLGELFDVRVAGNVVDDDVLGSIEYGVEHCAAPLLVIMGHESCGAVTAAYDVVQNGTEVEGKIKNLVEEITPVIQDAGSLEEAITDNTEAVYAEVMEDEIVKELVEAGKLKVVKAYYDLDGTVSFE